VISVVFFDNTRGGKKTTQAGHKPSSVPGCDASGQWSFIWDTCCQIPLAAYPGASSGQLDEMLCISVLPYLALLQVGFT